MLYPIRYGGGVEADFRAGDYLGADVPTDTAAATILHRARSLLTSPTRPTYPAGLQKSPTPRIIDVSPELVQFQRNY